MSVSEVKSNSLWKRSLLIVIPLLLVVVVGLGVTIAGNGKLTIFAGVRPTNIGVISGKLAPCPNSPNCVSSFSTDAAHKIAPISYKSTSAEAIANLKQVINSLDRTQIIIETDNYLYAEFTSALMGFVDDVEFLLDEGKQVINVRSASRLGESDLGVNRQRIETIRDRFEQLKNSEVRINQ